MWLSGKETTGIYEDAGLIPAAAIRPLAWNRPYAADAALRSKKKKKKKSYLKWEGGQEEER